MEIYILLAISFAIMFTFRYTKDIIYVVKGVAKVHEVNPRNYFLNVLYIVFFILTAALWPVYLLVISTTERLELIQGWAKSILLRHYELELK